MTPEGATAFLGALRRLDLPEVGPFPYYARRESASHAPARLRRAVQAGQFEVLHFAPLYAPELDAAQLAVTLRRAARPRHGGAPPATLLEASLLATLSVDDRTAVLPDLADLIVQVAGSRAIPTAAIDELAEAWRLRYEPRLRPFLVSERLTSGQAIVSPDLGAEGRIFVGRPEDPGDNVIAVGLWAGAGREAPLLAILRELCYPAVSRSLQPAPGTDRALSARRAALGAVRCGAALADRVSPALGVAYRAQWASAGPRPGAPFDLQYPDDAVLSAAIARVLVAAFAPAPS